MLRTLAICLRFLSRLSRMVLPSVYTGCVLSAINIHSSKVSVNTNHLHGLSKEKPVKLANPQQTTVASLSSDTIWGAHYQQTVHSLFYILHHYLHGYFSCFRIHIQHSRTRFLRPGSKDFSVTVSTVSLKERSHIGMWKITKFYIFNKYVWYWFLYSLYIYIIILFKRHFVDYRNNTLLCMFLQGLRYELSDYLDIVNRTVILGRYSDILFVFSYVQYQCSCSLGIWFCYF